MNENALGSSLVYLVPHALALCISAGVGAYAVRQRAIPGALGFAVSAFGQAFWTLGYAVELTRQSVEGKVFWDDVQLLGTVAWALGFYSFAERYTQRPSHDGSARGRSMLWIRLAAPPCTRTKPNPLPALPPSCGNLRRRPDTQ